MERRILAFDIGIKNLAWCCSLRPISGSKTTILGWANENLITGGTADSDSADNKCSLCKNKAGFLHAATAKLYCVKHAPPLTPVLRDLSGNLLKKLPKLETLKEIATRAGASKENLKNKTLILAFLQTRYCLPKPVQKSIKKVELEEIHDGIRAVVVKNRDLFSKCTEILLENQPAYKNPIMKSVQMMLFASLRDILQPSPPKVRLVHASRKTVATTTAKGDEGYADRKNAAENRVLEGFRKGDIRVDCGDGRDNGWFSSQTKKSDLADCLCMTMDA
jgi:hypothetical protein